METMEMTFGDGSRLRNDFAKAQVNPALPPDLFDPKLGPEIKIVQPMAR
jgi:outer membrane lipoprotein-sorting protein